MMIPGRALHRFAAAICSSRTLERVVEPAIADLQTELLAPFRGHVWQRGWMLLSGYSAVVKVIAICALSAPAAASERDAVARTFAWSAAMVVMVAALLMVPPLYAFSGPITGWYAMSTLTQGLPLAIPIGIAFGIGFGLRARPTMSTAKRLLLGSLAASLLSFAVLAWAMPDANGDPQLAGQLWFSLHGRVALAAASLALASLLLTASASNRWFRAVLALAACVVYWVLMIVGEVANGEGYLPHALGAWLPNLVLVACVMLIAASRSSRLRGSVSAAR